MWWSGIFEDRATGASLGELVVHLTNGARTAEVGYTLARAAWGRGYAVEGLAALVAHLFDTFPLTRVWGGLHPDNRASAMVLERVGMTFEGHTKLSVLARRRQLRRLGLRDDQGPVGAVAGPATAPP